ncbi:hypothetical protein BDW62DRAFT_63553 [Aspergillus aurantiobrunneus]
MKNERRQRDRNVTSKTTSIGCLRQKMTLFSTSTSSLHIRFVSRRSISIFISSIYDHSHVRLSPCMTQNDTRCDPHSLSKHSSSIVQPMAHRGERESSPRQDEQMELRLDRLKHNLAGRSTDTASVRLRASSMCWYPTLECASRNARQVMEQGETNKRSQLRDADGATWPIRIK